MQSRRAGVPSPALVVSIIALVLALAGGATALPGNNKVGKNDIKKGAVTKKAIKKGAVKTRALKDGAVTNPKLADASVDAAKLAPSEAVHLVGAPGEPQFGNGGEDDCIWRNTELGDPISGARPAGFYKDPFGLVHMQGVAIAQDGPGGDGSCDPGDPGESEDGVVFPLPTDYQPDGPVLGLGGALTAVTGTSGANFSGTEIPPGGVWSSSVAILDGIEYRTVVGATPAQHEQ